MKYKIGFSNKQKKNIRSYKRRMSNVGLCVSDYEKSVSFMMTPFITVVAWCNFGSKNTQRLLECKHKRRKY